MTSDVFYKTSGVTSRVFDKTVCVAVSQQDDGDDEDGGRHGHRV